MRRAVDPQVKVAQRVTTGVYKGVSTSELDELAAETAASMTASHPDYAIVSRCILLLPGNWSRSCWPFPKEVGSLSDRSGHGWTATRNSARG